MREDIINLTAPDGHRLFVRQWRDSSLSEPRAVLHINHGVAEHCARYADVARHFTRLGYVVYAHDHRGHGFSVTGDEALGHFADQDGWKKVIEDVYLVNEHIRKSYPGTPVILMGHSMGSFIVQSYAIRHGDTIDTLVLSGSAFHTPFSLSYGELVMRIEAARAGQRGRSKLINLLTFATYNKTFSPVRTPADWLSRDSRQVDRYLEDTLCGFLCTNRLWLDLMHGLKEIIQHRNLQKIPNRIPVLLFSGEMDPMSYDPQEHGIKKLADRLKTCGQHTVHYRVFPKGRHEILNETNRDEVLIFWSQWLEHHAPLKRTTPQRSRQQSLDLTAA